MQSPHAYLIRRPESPAAPHRSSFLVIANFLSLNILLVKSRILVISIFADVEAILSSL